ATPGIDARQLRADTAQYGPGLEAAARRMFAEWLDSVGL
ncbi:glutamine amidotransferase, partial [Pseudomonas sp. MWU13-2625]